MPLPKRSIEPVYVARSVYQQDELQSVELETVTNTTLTNIIRQLSSLSKHAEDLFGELARDMGGIADRANSLQARIDRLSMKVTQLDSTVEEVPLTDITRKKAFKSAKIFDQQIFSRDTMPALMQETYSLCDKPPPLNKLNVYRDDGKDGLKFYTDPNYFFELWRQEMLKDTERVMHDKGKKMHRPRQEGANGGAGGRANKKRVRAPHNTREKQRQIAIGHGETLMPNNVIYRTPNQVVNEESSYGNMSGGGAYEVRPSRPESIELRRNYPPSQVDGIYGAMSPQSSRNVAGQYTPTYASNTNGMHPTQHSQMLHQQALQQHQQQIYNDAAYQQVQAYYGHPDNSMSAESIYAPGTPSRTVPRPSQPPPAPPSHSGGTPNTSNANTPTRGRSMSTSRDALPPPPPIPDGLMNSPSQMMNSNMNFVGMTQVKNAANDLPPPPPVPDQISPANVAPPPPPPPPPVNENDKPTQQQQQQQQQQPMANGIQLPQTNGVMMSGGGVVNTHVVGPKKLLPPFNDSRTDLMKAIRDGITLRKVEKSEQKEIERNTGLHDVASILARRVAIELSESEESDSDDDSEGWVEPNETSA